ncbi:hypothetical protein MNBD_ALPHA12-975 [hydrothermal vent metagenome]|uniref:Lipopolysaccharide export system permease protein LptG n=1 Tax=hydrothermal vent metagenome TaxID=652676 RepID=A0A3B0U904_9ZZZZ
MITHLDWFITRRIATRVFTFVLVFYGLIFLSESLDSWRFQRISAIAGQGTAWLAVATAAMRWSIKSLPVTVLVGAIISLLEFQSHREFVVIKAAGISIWRIMLGPVIFMALFGLVVTFAIETVSTQINREINPTPPGLGGGVARSTSDIWLEQNGADGEYFIRAESARNNGRILYNVTVFPVNGGAMARINAARADFGDAKWRLSEVKLTYTDAKVTTKDFFQLKTSSTVSDLRLIVGSTEDFTYFELLNALRDGVSDPIIRSAAATRLFKLTALPMLLVGSLLIAFAFTAGYRRDNSYGVAIIYGIMAGFVVFVITEMADRAGSSGVLRPVFATWGPAVVSVLVGLSVLLKKEDGRA